MKFIKVTYVFLFILVWQTGSAQNTGYGGKKYLFKTTYVNGIYSPVSSIKIEHTITRFSSVSLGFENYTLRFIPSYRHEEFETDFAYYWYGGKLPPVIPDKARLISRNAVVEYRNYIDRIFPCMRGVYINSIFKYCIMDVKGNYYTSLIQELNNQQYGNYISYNFKNVQAFQIELGGGYQHFLTKSIVIDLNLSINRSYFNINNQYDKKILSAIAKKYGSNLFRNTNHTLSNINKPSTHTTGVSIFGQIGFLLF